MTKLLRETDFKATLVENTWNCLPVAAQDEYNVALLYITGEGPMHHVYLPMAVAAAAESNIPVYCLNGYEYQNQPLIHSLQAQPLPQIFLLNAVGTVNPSCRYKGLRRQESLVATILELKNQ